jgi:mannose-1-phosphate guanylyltransferase
MPKQFIKLFDGKSLFQMTVERNSKVCGDFLMVAGREQYFMAMDQLDELSSFETFRARFLLEPTGRNTAPAIAMACMSLEKDEIVLVTPSDHLIKDEVAYAEVLNQAQSFAQKDQLVTFGITPDFAETGFGYIEADGYEVKAFHEKPDSVRAEAYIKAGNYYWNSGMFCFKAGVFLKELQRYAPDIFEASWNAYDQAAKSDMIRIGHEAMIRIPSESVDYAVMEHSKNVAVIPSNIGWSDVGSFDSLAQELPNDTSNNLVISDKQVELIGMDDTIVVDTGDALLIAKKGTSQRVRDVVSRLKKEGSSLTDAHLTGYRPWGSFIILDEVEGYKIKRIEVKSGKRLSLQTHQYRNEHWVVVSGTATVTINDTTFLLHQNESTYIKAGDVHRLSNEANEPLVIIEVQVGSYTGEDDIVRLEDDYNREER